ncbi:hypothetical protein LSPH24S_02316 [Lysinibacillus sphaericus]
MMVLVKVSVIRNIQSSQYNITQKEELSDIESRLLAAKQKAMDALTAADVVVFAFPFTGT